MYAVIETGGKQYRVEVGTELEVELLDVEPGKTVTIDRVLLVADGEESTIGRPLVADASVSAEVVTQTRGPKLISFKYRPKARSRVKKGHRQELTVLRITDVRLGDRSGADDVRQREAEAETQRELARHLAAKQAAADAELAAKLAATTPAEKPARGRGRGKSTPADAPSSAAKTKPKADASGSGKGSKAAAPKTTKSTKTTDTPPTTRSSRTKKET